MDPIVFRHKEIETMPQEALKALQKQKLQKTLEAALKTPFYKERLNGVGITRAEDVQTDADFQKIPYTTKHDLREAFPCGMLAADKADVVRMHASSGTTGVPTVVYLTQADLDKAAELNARSCACTGSTRNDVFQNMMTYGLFTGGLMLHYGAERLGMMVIPAGSGNTRRQLQLMKDFRTTVIHATPSYMLHMYDKMAEEGFALSDFAIKKAYIGAEPHSEDIRKKIESLYGIDAYNSYGLSEMNGPGLAFECVYKNGMHLWEDYYIGEIIDPETLRPLPDGERGELVLTILERNGMPILRYRTRDLTRFIPEPCPCGRTHRRLDRMTGRSDDMLIINGVNVFPSQIEEVIMKMPEIGNNYLIRVQKQGPLDKLTVKVEVTSSVFTDDTRDLENLQKRIQSNLQAVVFIRPAVELHEPGTLPVSQGKAVRVIDERKEN
ncbi:MAG: phenylacetate--CoA ligase [Spirochaetia bacterium]|nr:phenylacetate--CoA ligase [Spirochaetia bacterium]